MEVEKKWKHVLGRYKMGQPELFPRSIAMFDELIEQINYRLVLIAKRDKSCQLPPNLHKLAQLLDRSVQKMTINCVVKKIAILHALFHKAEEKKMLERLAISIQDLIKIVINENVREITQGQGEKRESSFYKVQNFIRRLSGSKERSKSKGKMAIENQKDKGAIVQITSKILIPFCFYFMKILQDYEAYYEIKRRERTLEGVLVWKVVNWSKSLGKIVLELNRLGHYFKDDLLALIVYFNFLISLDISVYYDLIKTHVQKEALKWKLLIKQEQQQLSNRFDCDFTPLSQSQSFKAKWIQKQQLCELKELILQMRSIKQKLNYIYGSSMLIDWHQYFRRPSKFTFRTNPTYEELTIDFILELFQKQSRRSSKNQRDNSRGSTQFKSEPYFDTLQTKESPQKLSCFQQSSANEDSTFNAMNQTAFAIKGAKANGVKSRLNKLMQSTAEKQKLMMNLGQFLQEVKGVGQEGGKEKGRPLVKS